MFVVVAASILAATTLRPHVPPAEDQSGVGWFCVACGEWIPVADPEFSECAAEPDNEPDPRGTA